MRITGRPGVTFKDLSQSDTHRPSKVQFLKVTPGLAPTPPACDPAPDHHPVLESYADTFTRANGPGFGSASWREVLTDLPFNPGDPNNSWPNIATVHLNAGNLQAFRATIDASMTVAGIYQAAAPGLNWYVEATLGPSAMSGPLYGGGMWVAALLAQTNPLDPAPILTDLTANALYWGCERHFPNPATEYEFHLGLGSVQSNLIVPPYVAPAGTVGPGSTFGLRIVCNGTTTRPTVQCFVNGAMVAQLVPSDGTVNLPAGRPGCGIFGQELAYPPNTQNVVYDSLASWRADRLAP